MQSGRDMSYWYGSILAFLIVTGFTSQAAAQDLTGWCFPADDCMGEPSEIKRNTFETCEETCQLLKPVRITGMNAHAYEQVCRGDSGNSRERVIIAKSTSNGKTTVLYVSNSFSTRLVRCR